MFETCSLFLRARYLFGDCARVYRTCAKLSRGPVKEKSTPRVLLKSWLLHSFLPHNLNWNFQLSRPPKGPEKEPSTKTGHQNVVSKASPIGDPRPWSWIVATLWEPAWLMPWCNTEAVLHCQMSCTVYGRYYEAEHACAAHVLVSTTGKTD